MHFNGASRTHSKGTGVEKRMSQTVSQSFEQRVNLSLHLLFFSNNPSSPYLIRQDRGIIGSQKAATPKIDLPKEETDETQKRLFSWLSSLANVRFTSSTHRPVLTSQDAADVRNVSLASGAKAMLVFNKRENVFSLLVLSAAKSLDWKRVRKMIGKKTGLATVEQVYSLTNCLPGAVPPFGSLFGVESYMDASLVEQGEEINFNCGLRTMSVHMSVEDYIKAEQPVETRFSA